LIVFGAFTRLTDSGLGCPDWPGCYGTSNPWHAIGEIQLAEANMPTGPVTVIKAWIEMIHRYLAMTVGALILIQVGLAFSKLKNLGKKPLLGSLGLLVLVCTQGAFGAWTVTLKLQPIIVTTHLMLALVLLACLTTYAQQDWEEKKSSSVDRFQIRPLSAKLLLLASVVLFTQIFLGAWVSTNYAVLACPDFPTCMGSLLPETAWQEGFTLWRGLGLNALGESISPVALQTIHWAHRLFAMLALVTLGLLGISALQLSSTLSGMGRIAKLLLGLIILQALTGISNVVFQWPLLAALMHTAGSAALVFCLVRLAQWSSWRAPIHLKMVKSL